jgi:hypothetical protein
MLVFHPGREAVVGTRTNLKPTVSGARIGSEPLSPELVLVDPELATLARARLPDLRDSLAPGKSRLHAGPQRPTPADEHPTTPAAEPVDIVRPSPPESHRRKRSRATRVLVGLAIVALVAAVLGWRAVHGSNDAAAPGPASTATQTRQAAVAAGAPRKPTRQPRKPTRQPKPAPKASLRTGKAPSPRHQPPGKPTARSESKRRSHRSIHRRPKPAPQRPVPHGAAAALPARIFVWPPVPHARFYDIQFFRNGRRILRAAPKAPRFRLRLKWSFRGRSLELKPGTYVWVVRPVTGSGRDLRVGKPITHASWVLR